MLPELLGVVIPAPVVLRLPSLLPRGTKSVLATAEEGEPSGLLTVSSTGAGIVVLWLFGRRLNIPVLVSALPPAYNGFPPFRLQQLHPVKKMPIPHAPIRPAKGILPIVLSSPV